MTSPSTATDAAASEPAALLTEPEAHLCTLAPELFQRLLRDGGQYADLFYECSGYHQRSLRQLATGNRLSRS